MIALEISVNGHHFRTIAVGSFGLLCADVVWTRTKGTNGAISQDFRLTTGGMEGAAGDTVYWPDTQLKPGDTVTIEIVEVDAPPELPAARTTQADLREIIARQHQLESNSAG